MARSARCRTASAVVEKAAALLTTAGFFAAAVFLATLLWMPTEAGPASNSLHVEPSLLLALDTPRRPAPKLHLRDLLTRLDDDEAMANLTPPDLTTELNNWTYTLGSLSEQVASVYISTYANALYFEITLLKNVALVYQTFFQDLGLQVPGFLTAFINLLSYEQAVLSPYR